jgi:hypothetical protein
VGRILELVCKKTSERSQVEKAEILRGYISQGWNNVKQRGCTANNGNLIARDTHVPQREVYQDQQWPSIPGNRFHLHQTRTGRAVTMVQNTN